MPAIHFDVSDQVLLSLKETPETMTHSLRLLAAAKLVELGRLSTGRAADLAGMGRVEFLLALGTLQVAVGPITVEELLQDARNA